MRENRPYGLEGGESGTTGLPYPYRVFATFAAGASLGRIRGEGICDSLAERAQRVAPRFSVGWGAPISNRKVHRV